MYFKTPQFSVAFNPKVASSSLSRAIIRDFWPDVETKIQTASYPAGKNPDNIRSQFLCPMESNPTNPVVLVVRDPVDRFRSSMAEMSLADVDSVLVKLEGQSDLDADGSPEFFQFFGHQHRLALSGAKIFRLDDLNQVATHIGLSLPLPVINESSQKPTLTQDQEARVLAYYAEDKRLYDSIPSGGADYPPAIAESLPVPATVTATQIRLWLVRNGKSMAQISEAIDSIEDDQARAEAEVVWEYAPYIERVNPLVSTIAATIGMDDIAVDQAFREASQL